ncbi:MAG TPA: hypothetical protein VFL57_15310, partial [Bryobacteraceae bacterium]|nr:hypothetical protein [Bryobacteraceae bacterium]
MINVRLYRSLVPGLLKRGSSRQVRQPSSLSRFAERRFPLLLWRQIYWGDRNIGTAAEVSAEYSRKQTPGRDGWIRWLAALLRRRCGFTAGAAADSGLWRTKSPPREIAGFSLRRERRGGASGRPIPSDDWC